MGQSLWKKVGQLLKELNTHLLYDPVMSLVGIYAREMKTYVHTKICIQIFVAVLFVIAPNWKPPKCPSTVEWINKLWYNHASGIYINDLLYIQQHR